jgi:hypothetical protein
MKKYEIAKKIEAFCKKHDLLTDTRIYFNKKCWNYNSSGNKTVLEDIVGSDYFDYANDDTISMTFEGGLYHVMNYGSWDVREAFQDMIAEYGYYAELGNAWNLALYKI